MLFWLTLASAIVVVVASKDVANPLVTRIADTALRHMVAAKAGKYVPPRLGYRSGLAQLGSETLSAEEADRWGLLTRLCAAEEVDAVVKDLAERLAALPPRSVAMIKHNLNRGGERSLEENLLAESFSQTLAFTSDDTREAIAAWVEKREPRFTGR